MTTGTPTRPVVVVVGWVVIRTRAEPKTEAMHHYTQNIACQGWRNEEEIATLTTSSIFIVFAALNQLDSTIYSATDQLLELCAYVPLTCTKLRNWYLLKCSPSYQNTASTLHSTRTRIEARRDKKKSCLVPGKSIKLLSVVRFVGFPSSTFLHVYTHTCSRRPRWWTIQPKIL